MSFRPKPQTMAEEHHLFDDIGGGMVDKNAYGIIVPRGGTIAATGSDNDAYIDKDIIKVPYLPDPSRAKQ